MIKIFAYPAESTNTRFKRVLLKVLPAVLIQLFSAVPLGYFMMQDSMRNRDAVRKVTSPETEISLLIVFAVFLLCVLYLSIIGIRESSALKRRFTSWVRYKGSLHIVTADFPKPYNQRRAARTIKAQEERLKIFRDEYYLRQLLDGEVRSSWLACYEIVRILEIKKTKKYTRIRLENGMQFTVYSYIEGYQELVGMLDDLNNA
ncbi:MAG: hypothetical protein IJX77_09740 [Ruminococcus sp.]|nr:hypothetical protein [Ruminococcus sp.]